MSESSNVDPPESKLTPVEDQWSALRHLTPARVALGRSGASLPTAAVLDLGYAHALARDAVHRDFDADGLGHAIAGLGLEILPVSSAAPDRSTYLRRPDLGRQLSAASRTELAVRPQGCHLVIVVADGLSATAVHANAPPLLAALLPGILAAGWRLAPIVLARQGRVALGDDVGAALGARMALVLIGERPGLSSPDSLGAYLTFAPRVGRRDNERNCVSNIRAAGLSADRAAASLLWLMAEGFRRSETGVALKDESMQDARLAPLERSNPRLEPGKTS